MKEKDWNFEVEPRYYLTQIYHTELEAWQDLMKVTNGFMDNHWVWFRELPGVNSQLNFDTKKMEYQGFTRFVVNPMVVLEDKDTLDIPSIGSI